MKARSHKSELVSRQNPLGFGIQIRHIDMEYLLKSTSMPAAEGVLISAQKGRSAKWWVRTWGLLEVHTESTLEHLEKLFIPNVECK